MASESYGFCIANDSSEPKSIKILILGEVGIGKTTLITSYFKAVGKTIEIMDFEEQDIFVTLSLRMKYKGNEVDVGFVDMNQSANSSERRECYPMDVNAIILCFSIAELDTLMSVYNLWIHEVRTHYGKLVPVLLVGLRSDVRLFKPGTIGYSILHQGDNRPVEKSEAQIIHKRYHFDGDYMECSMYIEDSVIPVIQKAFIIAMEDLLSA